MKPIFILTVTYTEKYALGDVDTCFSILSTDKWEIRQICLFHVSLYSIAWAMFIKLC